VNILEPENVKRFLVTCNWNEVGKEHVVEDFDRFYKFKQLKWNRRYESVDILPYIPKGEEVDALISGLSVPIGTFCLLLKETGCRPGQAWLTEWTHLDFERNTIVIRAEKKSRSRELRISNTLIGRLNIPPKDRKYVFHGWQQRSYSS
jgi:integrase